MATVFLCSPTNSQTFTTCCESAICEGEHYCPHCGQRVEPESGLWRYAYGHIKRGYPYGNWYPNHGQGRGYYERNGNRYKQEPSR